MSLIARYAPFNRFSPAPSFFREFDALLGALEPAAATEAAKVLTPSADVAEREHAFEVHVDLPGLAPEAITVKLEGDTLTVSGERKAEAQTKEGRWVRTERSFGTIARTFVLPESVIGTTPEATFANGVLTVTLPKKEESKPKSVLVKVNAR
jgi:HSP20 family protein